MHPESDTQALELHDVDDEAEEPEEASSPRRDLITAR
jgi:hypothetical protein